MGFILKCMHEHNAEAPRMVQHCHRRGPAWFPGATQDRLCCGDLPGIQGYKVEFQQDVNSFALKPTSESTEQKKVDVLVLLKLIPC
jgi:hypothetical protein